MPTKIKNKASQNQSANSNTNPQQTDLFKIESSFEDNFLTRTIGSLGKYPDIALTELVANAWDAGATKVDITMPDKISEDLIIEDDGRGMDKDEFCNRWMMLGYDRIQHQGKFVEFPTGRTELKRIAYGHNGTGRHGLLCFNNKYEVITWRNGLAHKFEVSITSGNSPLKIINYDCFEKNGHGTRLKVVVNQHLVNAESIMHILAARFLHDPNFKVVVNSQSVDLYELDGFIEEKEIVVNNSIKLRAYVIDTTKVAHTKQRQGIAFWVNNRLVGEASWILGQLNIIDGRTKFGRQYTFIFQSDDLHDQVLSDWSGFKKSEIMDIVYDKASEYVRSILGTYQAERVSETKIEVFRDNKSNIRQLSPLAKMGVEDFVGNILASSPTTTTEEISLAVQSLIKVENSRSGRALLEKIIKLREDDIDGLNRMLDTWSVRDALIVLDEVDRRIKVIEAIKRVCDDPNTSELDTLHPLITESRWLFGPEYESSEYAANISLKSAMKKLTGRNITDEDFINPKKRPDLIALSDSTISITAIEELDTTTGLLSIKHILLVELKKGAFTIGREEMTQAENYIEDIIHCGHIEPGFTISAFVVGYTVGSKITDKRTVGDIHKINATTFYRLIRTAEFRLFKLRERLSDRYTQISTDSILEQVLNEPEQISMSA